MGVGWGYYLFVLLYSPPCTEPLSPSLPPGDASLSSILPEVLFWSTHCCIKRKRTATKRNVPLVMKIQLNLFLCIHDDRKWFHQKPKATHSFCLSVQCLIDFEEIIVIFVVRWNVPFEMWKRAVWKYWTVWTKNTIKLYTLNVEGKSSQLRAKMTHCKTWLV